jgi:phospholipid-translocating ATPase
VLNALEQFFSEDQPEVKTSTELPSREDAIPLQRINTGVSTIVGAGNGNRVGGFVLVVDDSVLTEVNKTPLSKDFKAHMNLKGFCGR